MDRMVVRQSDCSSLQQWHPGTTTATLAAHLGCPVRHSTLLQGGLGGCNALVGGLLELHCGCAC